MAKEALSSFGNITMGYFEILCGIVILAIAYYYYLTSSFNHWKQRNVKGPTPLPLFGNIKDSLLARVSLVHILDNIYNAYKDEHVIGMFFRGTPVLMIKDPEILKDVLIKDFSKFPERGFTVTAKAEPLTQHLLLLDAAKWRPLRNKLSPAFTSGKLKEMFQVILECGKHLKEYLDKLPPDETIEFRDLTARFTTDVIGNCAFGIEMNALSEEESEFRKMGKKIFEPTLLQLMRIRLREGMPKFYNLIGPLLGQTELTKFFTRSIVETMEYREKNSIVRQDFVNILMQLRKHPDKLGGEIEMTDDLCAAQAFVFFAAGFETSSTTMSNALYELALNHDVQDRLREEIREQFAKHNDSLTYESVKNMPYLHAVFLETLRKYPPGTLIFRQSITPYKFKGTKVSVPKHQKILIPIYSIHHDPDIYPKPDQFDPERFMDSQVESSIYYLPFGKGPRNCIGERFAVYQTKLGLVTILRNHKVYVCEKTQIPYILNPSTFLLAPKGGIYLKLLKIKEN